jgi:hypothetical protein
MFARYPKIGGHSGGYRRERLDMAILETAEQMLWTIGFMCEECYRMIDSSGKEDARFGTKAPLFSELLQIHHCCLMQE